MSSPTVHSHGQSEESGSSLGRVANMLAPPKRGHVLLSELENVHQDTA